MSILINGMEMPKEGTVIAVYKIDGKLYATRGLSGRLFPLVPVPPHGDLIDRKPFVEFIKTHWDSYDQWFVEQLEARPTIIEAEEGE